MIELHAVEDGDLDTVFELERDPEAMRMAAFTRADHHDRAAFDGRLVGTVGSYVMEGDTEVTYWVDRAFWGRGIATATLERLLEEVTVRPAGTLSSRRRSCAGTPHFMIDESPQENGDLSASTPSRPPSEHDHVDFLPRSRPTHLAAIMRLL